MQDTVQCGCEYVSKGYSLGDGMPDVSPETQAEIEAHEREWALLFQMDTIETENYPAYVRRLRKNIFHDT